MSDKEAGKNITRRGRRDTSEDVAHAIGRRIVAGGHPPGTLLPTEHALCAALGVSRPTLREGFRLLGARGMIEGRRRVGTRVRPRAEWNMLDAAVLAWHLEQEPGEAYIGGLFEARMVVEPAAASLAAGRAQDGDTAAIADAFRRMAAAQKAAGLPTDDVAETVSADLAFHVAILAASGNLFLSSFGALIASSLTASFRLNWRAHASAPALSLARHEAVLDAIGNRDPARADCTMRALLASAAEDARRALMT